LLQNQALAQLQNRHIELLEEMMKLKEGTYQQQPQQSYHEQQLQQTPHEQQPQQAPSQQQPQQMPQSLSPSSAAEIQRYSVLLRITAVFSAEGL
jgi:hypothetical protein